MPDQSSALPKTIAVVRVATGFLFFLFGEYKVAGPAFAHGGFQQYLQGYIQGDAVSFYRPFLGHVVLPLAVSFGYVVGVLELFIAFSLLLGLWVRASSVLGALFMVNLALASWWAPGHGVAFWRYFGAELDTIPLFFLFLIFFTSDAGQTWGLDGAVRKRP
ncbi:MAG: DoxX family membrane protein [Terriglobales bacterium]